MVPLGAGGLARLRHLPEPSTTTHLVRQRKWLLRDDGVRRPPDLWGVRGRIEDPVLGLRRGGTRLCDSEGNIIPGSCSAYGEEKCDECDNDGDSLTDEGPNGGVLTEGFRMAVLRHSPAAGATSSRLLEKSGLKACGRASSTACSKQFEPLREMADRLFGSEVSRRPGACAHLMCASSKA